MMKRKIKQTEYHRQSPIPFPAETMTYHDHTAWPDPATDIHNDSPCNREALVSTVPRPRACLRMPSAWPRPSLRRRLSGQPPPRFNAAEQSLRARPAREVKVQGTSTKKHRKAVNATPRVLEFQLWPDNFEAGRIQNTQPGLAAQARRGR